MLIMKKRVLLIDDEAGITRMIRRNLEATGRFEVQEVNIPTDALETARQFLPDIVVCDVMMPGMDGGAVAEAFAGDPKLAAVPFVFLTAIVTQQEVEPSGSKIGSHIFMAKPVKYEELVACIDAQTKAGYSWKNRCKSEDIE